jgi:hypothetical protein
MKDMPGMKPMGGMKPESKALDVTAPALIKETP